jgi:hypothetical protein
MNEPRTVRSRVRSQLKHWKKKTKNSEIPGKYIYMEMCGASTNTPMPLNVGQNL